MEKIKVDFSVESDAKVLSEMNERFDNCPAAIKYCKQLGIPDEVIRDNISLVNDFVCDVNYCKKCPGVKNCRKDNPTVTRKVTYVNGHLDIQLTPCRKALERYTVSRQFTTADFPAEWKENGYDCDCDKTIERGKAILALTKWINQESSDWIYLTGAAGTGRSYLAFVLSNNIAKKNLGPICYINCPNRLRELSDMKYSSDFNSVLDLYSNVPVLVLDDFGNEFKSDFIRDAILTQIINNRSSKKLMTIFTSDFSIDEIGVLYSSASRSGKAAEIMSGKIVKTIKSNCKNEINLGEISVYR